MQKLGPKPPQKLKKTQEWFAGIITVPIDVNSCIHPFAPSGLPIEEEAQKVIVPSPTLKPCERIQIYNQQYWWRLLNTMHDAVPFVTRLFGYYDFNQIIAIPYLLKYPPDSWSLNTLSDRLAHWIEEEYHDKDKALICNAAKIDWAYNKAFFTAQHPLLTNEDVNGQGRAKILKIKLYLQPYVFLFQLPYDLFSFRKEMLKENPEHWVENDFPKLAKDKPYAFILYRKRNNSVSWKELSSLEYSILEKFRLGESIERICAWIETQEPALQEQAASNLIPWFQEWTSEGILTKKKSKRLS